MVSLPVFYDEDANEYQPVSPRQALRVAINLKKLIDTIVQLPLPDKQITWFDLKLPKEETINAILEAAGGEGNGPKSSSRRYQACLIFCLLKVSGWYSTLAEAEPADSDLYTTRGTVAEFFASTLIEREHDDKYLFLSMLCHRYSINLNDVDSDPENALELAVDTHSLIISSPGYQRCIKWLWNGWIVQSRHDPSEYVLYKKKSDTSFIAHFDPDRIKSPLYQNALEIFFAIVFLAFYTIVANLDSIPTNLTFSEIILFIFTCGFAFDEISKVYQLGTNYIHFSNVFNDILYSIIFVSFGFRFAALSNRFPSHNIDYDYTSQRFISVAAPFMWIRMFFFCDLYKFFGVIIVIINTMMKESMLFFFMLSVVIIGFLQAFIGLDQADGKRDLTYMIITNMLQTILSGPDFSSIERFAYPYGSVLYYSYNFLVTVILLNILIALFSQAYSEVVENATEEYLHQYARRVLRYIRAPDAKVFFPPFNLIEIFLMDIPLSWWLDQKIYNNICNMILLVIYFPALFLIAKYESNEAERVNYNRQLNLPDDANEENREWILDDGYDDDVNNDENYNIRLRNLQRQRDAELVEHEFAKHLNDWSSKIENLAPPMKEATDRGVSIETYEILSQISLLNDKIELILKQNAELNAAVNKLK
ncbi:hypothetical protein CANINC_000357 [Pichia inconspicua]|uniref:Ion transport domain-containing protein n=1 Tax=Pichia inconspicua TaxID=52247 RepID=A0A4T0X6X6_9ASCO|nr:hypothetical protein CANINC_000357 [[Candida] inconspicua]